MPQGKRVGAASLNLSELAVLNSVTAGVAAAGKAVVLDSNKDIATLRHVTLSGNMVHGATTIDETDIAKIDAITNGAAAASKALVTDANKGISGYAQIVTSKNANFTAAAADSHGVYLITAADKIATLPPTVAGLRFTFIVAAAALSAGTGFSISPDAADKIMNNGITSADNKDLINSGATDAEGDTVSIVGDGVDGWYVFAQRGTWAREA